MSIKVAVFKESGAGEKRVALTPDSLSKLVNADITVSVYPNAGLEAFFPDEAYKTAGASVDDVIASADVVLKVLPPTLDEAKSINSGATLISTGQPASFLDAIKELASKGCSVFAMDLLPRISRAQSMDSLSSQASAAGYKAVLLAAMRLPKFFPMLMTAAGTIPPAKVLVMGAGVAGLQAIATAKRLGAQVSAYDVRGAVKEEVQSLGAKFVELNLEVQEGQGGYAGEQSSEFQAKLQELIGETVRACDVVITTAAIPGRSAPILITKEMVEGMRPGSIIVDLAASTGGNCELTVNGEDVNVGGVTIIGTSELPSAIATNASQLYAKNLVNFLLPMIKEGQLEINLEDEVVSATCVVYKGEVRHGPTKELLAK